MVHEAQLVERAADSDSVNDQSPRNDCTEGNIGPRNVRAVDISGTILVFEEFDRSGAWQPRD